MSWIRPAPTFPHARLARMALLAVSLFLLGCSRSTVRIPASDATPPLALLDAIGLDTAIILMVGDEPESVILDRDDSLVLVAIGEDWDGGIKDLTLVGNAVVTCSEREPGAPASRATGFMRKTVSGSAPRHRAPRRKTHRFVLRAADFAALCPGRNIAAVVGQANVRTVNFHGGHSASPRLEFRLARPAPSESAIAGNPPPSECPATGGDAGHSDGGAGIVAAAAVTAPHGDAHAACLESSVEAAPAKAVEPVNPGGQLSPRLRKNKPSAGAGRGAPKTSSPDAARRAGI